MEQGTNETELIMVNQLFLPPMDITQQKMHGYFPEYSQVLLRRTNGPPETFATVAELNERLRGDDVFREAYHRDVTLVHVYERTKELPVAWPDVMQILDVRFSLCHTANIPPLPRGLRSASFFKCPLLFHFDVPAACACCPNLEEVVLYGSCVRTIHQLFPHNSHTYDNRNHPSELRVIDASYTPVHSIHIEKLPPTLAILYVTNNVRDEGHYVVNNTRHNLDIVGHGANQNVYGTPPPMSDSKTPYVQFWTQGHNVHARSVQDAANRSMDSLWTAYQAALDQMGNIYKKEQWVSRGWMESCMKLHEKLCVNELCFQKNPLEAYLDDTTVHSLHSVTLVELLRRVWTVVTVHPSREDLEHVFYDEMMAGRTWCFTGKFMRIMNTLCGFVEGVQISISAEEEMQNRLSVLWKKASSLGKGDEDQHATKAKEREGLCHQACAVVISAGKNDWNSAETWLSPFFDVLYPDAEEEELCQKFTRVVEYTEK